MYLSLIFPLKPETEPFEGKSKPDINSPSRLKKLTLDCESLRYSITNLLFIKLNPDIGRVVSFITSSHEKDSFLLISNLTIFQFGAFLFVKNQRSLPLLPKNM